jgi:hypothetical protein
MVVEDDFLPGVEVPNSQQIKLSRWLFSRVLASHAGGQGSSPGRDMSALALVRSRDSGDPDVIDFMTIGAIRVKA